MNRKVFYLAGGSWGSGAGRYEGFAAVIAQNKTRKVATIFIFEFAED